MSFLAQFNEKVAGEEKCLYYNFTFKDDLLCCREAYQDADGVRDHLENCGALLGVGGQVARLEGIVLVVEEKFGAVDAVNDKRYRARMIGRLRKSRGFREDQRRCFEISSNRC